MWQNSLKFQVPRYVHLHISNSWCWMFSKTVIGFVFLSSKYYFCVYSCKVPKMHSNNVIVQPSWGSADVCCVLQSKCRQFVCHIKWKKWQNWNNSIPDLFRIFTFAKTVKWEKQAKPQKLLINLFTKHEDYSFCRFVKNDDLSFCHFLLVWTIFFHLPWQNPNPVKWLPSSWNVFCSWLIWITWQYFHLIHVYLLITYIFYYVHICCTHPQQKSLCLTSVKCISS